MGSQQQCPGPNSKDADLVCNNNNVPKTGTWHFLFCGAQKESMSLLSAAVSKKMTFDQLDAAFSDLIYQQF